MTGWHLDVSDVAAVGAALTIAAAVVWPGRRR